MLQPEEIKQITAALAPQFAVITTELKEIKETMFTKEEQSFFRASVEHHFGKVHQDSLDLQESVQKIDVAVDGFTKPIQFLRDEYAPIIVQLGEHEKSIKRLEAKQA